MQLHYTLDSNTYIVYTWYLIYYYYCLKSSKILEILTSNFGTF